MLRDLSPLLSSCTCLRNSLIQCCILLSFLTSIQGKKFRSLSSPLTNTKAYREWDTVKLKGEEFMSQGRVHSTSLQQLFFFFLSLTSGSAHSVFIYSAWPDYKLIAKSWPAGCCGSPISACFSPTEPLSFSSHTVKLLHHTVPLWCLSQQSPQKLTNPVSSYDCGAFAYLTENSGTPSAICGL